MYVLFFALAIIYAPPFLVYHQFDSQEIIIILFFF